MKLNSGLLLLYTSYESARIRVAKGLRFATNSNLFPKFAITPSVRDCPWQDVGAMRARREREV